MELSDSLKTIVVTVLAALAGMLYGFILLLDSDEYYPTVLGEFALLTSVMMSAMAGIAFEVNWISRVRSERLRSVINVLLIAVMVLVAGVYPMVQYFGFVAFGTYEDILKTAMLVVLIWIGAVLGAKIGIQFGVFSIGGATNVSNDVHPARSITYAALAKWLQRIALIALVVVLLVAALAPPDLPICLVQPDPSKPLVQPDPSKPLVQPDPSKPLVQPDPSKPLVRQGELFTASATIMGFAAFGSAMSTLGRNKDMIKGIAYTLIPVIVVQAVFMLSLLGCATFPAVLWIVMTAVFLMLSVLAMVANRIKSVETDDDTDSLQHS